MTLQTRDLTGIIHCEDYLSDCFGAHFFFENVVEVPIAGGVGLKLESHFENATTEGDCTDGNHEEAPPAPRQQ